VEGEEPDDEEERAPRPVREEAPARREQGLADEQAPPATPEALGEVEVFQEVEVLVADSGRG
jgi:hypothetical protein